VGVADDGADALALQGADFLNREVALIGGQAAQDFLLLRILADSGKGAACREDVLVESLCSGL
jgi:hypothetical protein